MIEAVIFDVDGTLVDSVDAHAMAWAKAFAAFGHAVDAADIRTQIGKGGDQLLPVFLPPGEIERIGSKLEKVRKDLFARDSLHSIRGFPQVRALFDRLAADGKRLALASSAKDDELQVYKDKAGIADMELVETSSDDAERSKPHPDIFEAALGRLKLAPAVCVVVGDTPYDAEGARKAGIRSTGLLCGGFPAADIRAAGASQIFADPADLLAHYDSWLATLDG